MLLRRRRRRFHVGFSRAHASLNTLLDSRAKKLIITLSLFDKAFFVFFFFFFFFFLAAGSSFFLSTTQSFYVREREESPTHLYTLSLSFVCVCVGLLCVPLTTFILLLKREGEEETKKNPPPPKKKKKLPGVPNLGFHKFFLGFYLCVCVLGRGKDRVVRKSSFVFSSLITLNLLHVRKSTHTHTRARARAST